MSIISSAIHFVAAGGIWVIPILTFGAIGVTASTGGPEAVRELVRGIGSHKESAIFLVLAAIDASCRRSGFPALPPWPARA